ncbi:hypothetical protein SADUNF_Sadunf07G0064600 [Salix dunnii]|uniref:Uncharacterized protein n=1 Tax=Salix dunnii TaxID=1413687 RepID=A0A835K0H5_9ROSI|nr:hypothetical protein SADUNF_Sadunf07G0064600 [Salix dunnii]
MELMLAYHVVVNLTAEPSVGNQYGKDTGACNPSADSIELDSSNPSTNQTCTCSRNEKEKVVGAHNPPANPTKEHNTIIQILLFIGSFYKCFTLRVLLFIVSPNVVSTISHVLAFFAAFVGFVLGNLVAGLLNDVKIPKVIKRSIELKIPLTGWNSYSCTKHSNLANVLLIGWDIIIRFNFCNLWNINEGEKLYLSIIRRNANGNLVEVDAGKGCPKFTDGNMVFLGLLISLVMKIQAIVEIQEYKHRQVALIKCLKDEIQSGKGVDTVISELTGDKKK